MSRFKGDCLHQQQNRFHQALIKEIARLFQPTIVRDYVYSSCKRYLDRAKMA